MVAVASLVNPAGEGSERVSGVLAFFLNQDFAVEYLSFVKAESFCLFVHEWFGDHNLVEEVPGIFVSQGADSFLKQCIHGVKESLWWGIGRF